MSLKAFLRGTSVLMFLALFFVIPVTSQQLKKPEIAIFNGSARFISYFYEPGLPQPQPPTPSDGDECSFIVSGKKMNGECSGHGYWEDQYWDEGALKAVFTISDVGIFKDPIPQNPDIFQLTGEAAVFIKGDYIGSFFLLLEICESKLYRDWARFYLFQDASQNPPPWFDPWKNCYYWSASGNGLLNGGIRAKVIR